MTAWDLFLPVLAGSFLGSFYLRIGGFLGRKWQEKSPVVIVTTVMLFLVYLSCLVIPYLKANPLTQNSLPTPPNIWMNSISLTYMLWNLIKLFFDSVYYADLAPGTKPIWIIVLCGIIAYFISDFIVWGWPYDPPKRKKKKVIRLIKLQPVPTLSD